MLAVTKALSSPRRRLQSIEHLGIGHSCRHRGGLFYLYETLVPMSASRGRDRCDCNPRSGPFMSRLPMIRLRQGDAPVVNSHLPKAKRQAMVTPWPDCGRMRANPVFAVTKRRNSAALVICRTAKLNWWGQSIHARRQRVGPLFRQIVEGAAVVATRSGPFFARLAIWQRPKLRRAGSVLLA